MRNLKSLWVILQNEPVLTRTALGSVLVLLAQFGLPISDGLANAITGAVVAVLAVGARSKVTPVDAAPRAILGKAGNDTDILGKA